jgi:hypothetical protein
VQWLVQLAQKFLSTLLVQLVPTEQSLPLE